MLDDSRPLLTFARLLATELRSKKTVPDLPVLAASRGSPATS